MNVFDFKIELYQSTIKVEHPSACRYLFLKTPQRPSIECQALKWRPPPSAAEFSVTRRPPDICATFAASPVRARERQIRAPKKGILGGLGRGS